MLLQKALNPRGKASWSTVPGCSPQRSCLSLAQALRIHISCPPIRSHHAQAASVPGGFSSQQGPTSCSIWGAFRPHTLQGLPSRPPCYEAATVTCLGWQRTSSCTRGFDPFPGALQVTRSWQEKEVTLLCLVFARARLAARACVSQNELTWHQKLISAHCLCVTNILKKAFESSLSALASASLEHNAGHGACKPRCLEPTSHGLVIPMSLPCHTPCLHGPQVEGTHKRSPHHHRRQLLTHQL